MYVRVTDPDRCAELAGYLDRLGLDAIVRGGGMLHIHIESTGWYPPRFEIECYIDRWVQRHAIPVQVA